MQQPDFKQENDLQPMCDQRLRDQPGILVLALPPLITAAKAIAKGRR
jgi:hypothetical protein